MINFVKQIDIDDKINDEIFTIGSADQSLIAISPTTRNVILIMNLNSYLVEHVLEFGSKCTGFLRVKDYFIASNMSDEGVG